uniref:Uncharacterized protein n=1 Tax=Cannabis sativa TaxID=3483 RepID=A0A803NMT4_CANSA
MFGILELFEAKGCASEFEVVGCSFRVSREMRVWMSSCSVRLAKSERGSVEARWNGGSRTSPSDYIKTNGDVVDRRQEVERRSNVSGDSRDRRNDQMIWRSIWYGG